MKYINNIQLPGWRVTLAGLVSCLLLTGCASSGNNTDDNAEETLDLSNSQSYSSPELSIPSFVRDNNKINAAQPGNIGRKVETYPISIVNANIDSNSYGNMRRAILQSRLPAKNEIKLEEWVNYFTYNDPQPKGLAPFSINTEIAPTPWDSSTKLLRIGIQAAEIKVEHRPINTVFLIDTSAEMNNPAGLPLVQTTLREFANTMHPDDTLTLIGYSTLPYIMMQPAYGNDHFTIQQSIDALPSKVTSEPPSTLTSFTVAYQLASELLNNAGENRIIFAGSGQFVSSQNDRKALEKLITDRKQQGITLNTLAFNYNNYDFNAMLKLADLGGGSHAFIDTPNEAKRVITQVINQSQETVARDLELQVAFDPKFVSYYRLIGFSKVPAASVSRDSIYINRIPSGYHFTALYEILLTSNTATPPAENALIQPSPIVQPLPIDAQAQTESQKPVAAITHDELGQVSLHYTRPNQPYQQFLQTSLVPAQVKDANDKTSDNFRFSAAVVAFGLHLNQDPSVDNYSLDEIYNLAKNSTGGDPLELKAEFSKIVRQSALINSQ